MKKQRKQNSWIEGPKLKSGKSVWHSAQDFLRAEKLCHAYRVSRYRCVIIAIIGDMLGQQIEQFLFKTPPIFLTGISQEVLRGNVCKSK
jgi:hypothetical protein